ncbi:hypothetical protein [Pseudoramibacter sp.]|jgi:vacuolar-type H+-ATPase subunit H|uniref:hypothetical protein n=1 Tax=Pseudoramibacter sp. TaxID=2034862 RepID=UPI0025DDA1BE|nr:hypothetical protein [Pseudoramibacter sp.]MCH4072868.1 hypothetical protein [Pseudoramibacter sp.]MCH4106639.1 hypothetical protein [Pseudoramibacter sp.]
MSVIDDIRQAENKADQIRLEAKQKAKEIIREARQEAEEYRKDTIGKVSNTNLEKLKKEEKEQKELLQMRLKESLEQDERFIENNRSHLSEAVQYIIEKVKSI